MVVGSHQLVVFRYLYQFVYLSGIHQMVSTHNRLVLRDGRWDIVKVIQCYQAATLNVVQSGLIQCLADVRVVRRYQHLYGILARRFESAVRCLAVGQQPAHGNDRQ